MDRIAVSGDSAKAQREFIANEIGMYARLAAMELLEKTHTMPLRTTDQLEQDTNQVSGAITAEDLVRAKDARKRVPGVFGCDFTEEAKARGYENPPREGD